MMSAEAPRNSGAGEPIPPQKPEGGFSGFFRRIFTAPPTQPQPGLEGFVGNLQQIRNDYSTKSRQQELELRNAEVSRIAATAAREAEAAQKQKEREEFFRAKKREALKVLQDFQISEKLKHIQKTVWEGKGIIRPVPEEDFRGRHSGSDWLRHVGGLELVHQYPGSRKVTDHYSPEGGSDYSVDRYVSYVGVTRLRVMVTDIEHESGESEIALLEISSGTYSPSEDDIKRGIRAFTNFMDVNLPLKAEDNVVRLEQVLLDESIARVNSGILPSQLEKRAGKELIEARQNSRG